MSTFPFASRYQFPCSAVYAAYYSCFSFSFWSLFFCHIHVQTVPEEKNHSPWYVCTVHTISVCVCVFTIDLFVCLFDSFCATEYQYKQNSYEKKITDAKKQTVHKTKRNNTKNTRQNESLTVWQSKYWMCICFIAWTLTIVLAFASTNSFNNATPKKYYDEKECERMLARAHAPYLLNTHNLIWNVEFITFFLLPMWRKRTPI